MKPILIIYLPQHVRPDAKDVEQIRAQVVNGVKEEYHVLIVNSDENKFDFKVVK